MNMTRRKYLVHVLDNRAAYGMTDAWTEYLCIEKVNGRYKLFIGGIPPRCRKIREDDSYASLVFDYDDDTAIRNWLDENRWKGKHLVARVKNAIKEMADTN
jgi:hypothetical protein